MIKKITTYAMLILFAASTTSLPITKTICRMKGGFSNKTCAMMNHAMKPGMKTCGDNANDYSHHYQINSNDRCCTTRTIDNSIKDNYVIHKVRMNARPGYQHNQLDKNLPGLYNYYRFVMIVLNDTSPGVFKHDKILLSSSILLI